MAKNETSFRPGVSGNPGGRPRTRPLADLLADELAKPAAKSGQQRDQRLIERLVTIALTGPRNEALRAMQLILAYRDGLPIARQETGGAGAFSEGFEIRLVHVADDEQAHDDDTASA